MVWLERKSMMRGACAISLATVLLLSTPSAGAQNLSGAEAAKHVGEQATVCGTIAGQHTLESAKGKPTFVDLDHPFPHQSFTVVIWDDDKSKVGAFPSAGMVCVTGTIGEHKGNPQMVLHDARDWSVPSAR